MQVSPVRQGRMTHSSQVGMGEESSLPRSFRVSGAPGSTPPAVALANVGTMEPDAWPLDNLQNQEWSWKMRFRRWTGAQRASTLSLSQGPATGSFW